MKLSLLRFVVLMIGTVFLAACGGGTGDSTSSGSGTGSGASPALDLSLLNSLGAATTTISESQSGTLRALLLDASGVPVPSQVVSFTLSDATVAVLDPVSGTALTNASGIASISLKAGAAAGAATATATAVVGSDTATDSASFSSSLANIALGSGSGLGFSNGVLTASVVPPTELSAGGTMTITATVVNQSSSNALFTTPVEVVFTSGCAAASTAQVDGSVTTVNGVATATYRASGCVGSDTVTATVAGGLSATVDILIAAATAGSIEFTSATPSDIAIKGTSTAGRPESSIVKFVIRDIGGNPVANKRVDFSLNNTLGGLALSPAFASSNSLGEVQTTVQSGTVQTTVRVAAEHDLGGSTISTVSDNLVVSVGLPDSDSISLSLSSHNPEAGNFDGEEVDVIVHLADHFNAAVEGTAVTFVSENGGAMAPTNCVTDDTGSCSVKWISGGTRPTTATGGGVKNGMISILAYTDGEESFSDTNGNGFFDVAELATVDQLSEAFLDEDEDGRHDLAEPYFDVDGDAQYSDHLTAPSGRLFNGVICSAAAKSAGHCAQLIHVRSSQVLVASTSAVNISIFPSQINLAGGQVSVVASVADLNGNSPAGGSTVTFSTSAGALSGQTSFTVPDQTGFWNTPSVTLKQSGTDASGFLTVSVVSPKGLASSNQASVINAAAP